MGKWRLLKRKALGCLETPSDVTSSSLCGLPFSATAVGAAMSSQCWDGLWVRRPVREVGLFPYSRD